MATKIVKPDLPSNLIDQYGAGPETWATAGTWFSGFASSNVAQMRYDASGNLWVDFYTQWGGHYSGVPLSVALAFYDSYSKGKFVHASLKNKYTWHR